MRNMKNEVMAGSCVCVEVLLVENVCKQNWFLEMKCQIFEFVAKVVVYCVL